MTTETMSISSASTAPEPGRPAAIKKKRLSSTAAGGAALLIALQVGSRALTFIVNQILLRYLSPELLGTSTQLEVYSITVLFCARESLRVAIQREPDTANDAFKADDWREAPTGQVDGRSSAGRTQVVVNLAYISIYLGAIFAFALAWVYVQLLSAKDPAVLETSYFRGALKIYGLAAFGELLSEPCFVVVQQKSEFKIRTYAELIATLLRCIVTAGSAVWASRVGRDIGVLPFALGQSMYAVSLIIVYYWNVWGIATTCGFSLTPVPIYSRSVSALCCLLSKS
jgi:oligosaccharide translocation protein RFT1